MQYHNPQLRAGCISVRRRRQLVLRARRQSREQHRLNAIKRMKDSSRIVVEVDALHACQRNAPFTTHRYLN